MLDKSLKMMKNMKFKKKVVFDELLENVEINNNNIGNCFTNRNALG